MKFKVVKKENYKKALIPKVNGYKVKPRNNVSYEGVKVNQMVIIKPSFIDKVLKRKTKKKLELYLEFLISLLDEEGTNTDPGRLGIVLNDLTRYKSIINNNYRVYLDKLYYELLMKKIDVIENELKMRLMYASMTHEQTKEEKIGKSR